MQDPLQPQGHREPQCVHGDRGPVSDCPVKKKSANHVIGPSFRIIYTIQSQMEHQSAPSTFLSAPPLNTRTLSRVKWVVGPRAAHPLWLLYTLYHSDPAQGSCNRLQKVTAVCLSQAPKPTDLPSEATCDLLESKWKQN